MKLNIYVKLCKKMTNIKYEIRSRRINKSTLGSVDHKKKKKTKQNNVPFKVFIEHEEKIYVNSYKVITIGPLQNCTKSDSADNAWSTLVYGHRYFGWFIPSIMDDVI